MLRTAVVAVVLSSTCARDPVASAPTKAATPAKPSSSSPPIPSSASASPAAAPQPGPAASAEALAGQLEAFAEMSDPATAAKLREGADDARAIGTQLDAMDRADKTMKAIQPSIDAMARIMRMQRDRGMLAADIDADAMVHHQEAVLERLAQLDRDLEASPDDRGELEDAALDDIMALVGPKRAK